MKFTKISIIESRRGSFTIELSLIIIAVLFLFLMVFFIVDSSLNYIIRKDISPDVYNRYFNEKIEHIRLEKVIKEDR